MLCGSRLSLSSKSPEQKRSVQSPRERGRIRTNEKSPWVRQSSSSPRSRSLPSCRIASEDKSPYKSPVGQAKEQMNRDASSSPPRKFRENRESFEKEKRGNHKSKPMEKRPQNSTTSMPKDSALNVRYREYSPERFSTHGVVESQSDQKDVEIRSKDPEKKREKKEAPKTPYLQKSTMMHKDSLPDERKHPSYPGEDSKFDENRSYSKNMKGSSWHH